MLKKITSNIMNIIVVLLTIIGILIVILIFLRPPNDSINTSPKAEIKTETSIEESPEASVETQKEVPDVKDPFEGLTLTDKNVVYLYYTTIQ